MSKTAERMAHNYCVNNKIGEQYGADVYDAYVAAYDQSAKDTIARIEKWAGQNTNNAHDMPNSRKDKMFYEGEDSMISKLFVFLSELEEEYE